MYDELADFYIVRPGDTLSKIAAVYFGGVDRWPELHGFNRHIKDANLIYPGDVIFLPDPEQRVCRFDDPTASELRAMSEEVKSLTPTEQRFLSQDGGVLDELIDDGVKRFAGDLPLAAGSASAWLGRGYTEAIQHTIRDIEENFLKILRSKDTQHAKRQRFLDYRKKKMKELERLFGEVIAHRVKNRSRRSYILRVVRKPKRGAYKLQLERLAGKVRLFRRLGYIGIAVGALDGYIKIKEAWGSEAQMLTVFQETGRFAGGLVGAPLGVYLGCNLLFGIKTMGASLVLCGLIVGSASGAALSEGGRLVGGVAYKHGDFILDWLE